MQRRLSLGTLRIVTYWTIFLVLDEDSWRSEKLLNDIMELSRNDIMKSARWFRCKMLTLKWHTGISLSVYVDVIHFIIIRNLRWVSRLVEYRVGFYLNRWRIKEVINSPTERKFKVKVIISSAPSTQMWEELLLFLRTYLIFLKNSRVFFICYELMCLFSVKELSFY